MEKLLASIAGITMTILSVIFLILGIVGYVIFEVQYQIISVAFLVIGTAFVLMMLVFMRMASRYRNETHRLKNEGRKVQAAILKIRENKDITINDQHPYVLICEAEGRTFESEYFYDDVHRFDGKEVVNVYLDEQNDDYFIDLNS